jgi:polyphosphate glucokinase
MVARRRTWAIGVDIGGSGIKAAVVDTRRGVFVTDRIRVPTPTPSTPRAILNVVRVLVSQEAETARLGPDAAVGVGIPAPVIDGVTTAAANIDKGWVGFHVQRSLARSLRRRVLVVNDADAAGEAEVRFGAARGKRGTIVVLTLGTGVGSAVFVNGVLVPNIELGHLEIRGKDAETRSSAAARVRRRRSWKRWALDLDEHLDQIETLFSPNLIVLGGGISKRIDKFVPFLTTRAPIVPATLRNDAGIIGAALLANEAQPKRRPAARRRSGPLAQIPQLVDGARDDDRFPGRQASIVGGIGVAAQLASEDGEGGDPARP